MGNITNQLPSHNLETRSNLSDTIEGACFRFLLDSWEGEREFVVVRKLAMQLLPKIQYSFLRGIFYKVNGQPEPLLPCERNYLTFPEGCSTVLAEWL